MHLTARKVRSIESANIEIGAGTTYLIGGNGAGKSTLCLCAGALLTGDGKLGWRAKDGRQTVLVRQGQREARAELLAGDGGKVTISWPAGEVLVHGDPPTASRIAAGLDKPAAMAPEERAAALIEALKAAPTEQDWRQALAAADIGEHEAATTLWKLIQRDGWDAGQKHAEKLAREKKGAWCEAAKRRAYAPKEAEGWQPSEATLDLAALDAEEPERRLAAAKAARDEALKQQAVSDAERERLATQAGHADAIAATLERVEHALAADREKRAAKKRTLENTGLSRALCPCPHCEQPVEIWPETEIGQPLRKPGRHATVNSATLAAWRSELADFERAIKHGEAELARLRAALAEAQAAAATLAGLPERSDDLAVAERALTEAEALRDAYGRWDRARTLHAEIGVWLKLAELAGREGVRKAKLGQLLDLLNQDLAELCAAARWPVVLVEGDLEVTAAGRPWRALSQSERWRADAALALAIGRRDGSALAVLDGADVLDVPGRNGLAKAIKAAGVPALVAMTLPRAQADKMAAAGAEVWWIGDGTALRLAGEQREAA